MAEGKNELDELHGISLTALLLSVNTLRMLKEKKLFAQDDVNGLIWSAMNALENRDVVSEPAAHAARSLLSGFAKTLEVPLRQPN